MTIVFDRIASVGGWLHAIDERDLGTELPLRNEDFESEVGYMPTCIFISLNEPIFYIACHT